MKVYILKSDECDYDEIAPMVFSTFELAKSKMEKMHNKDLCIITYNVDSDDDTIPIFYKESNDNLQDIIPNQSTGDRP